MTDSRLYRDLNGNAVAVRTGEMETRFNNLDSAAVQIGLLHSEIALLRKELASQVRHEHIQRQSECIERLTGLLTEARSAAREILDAACSGRIRKLSPMDAAQYFARWPWLEREALND